MSMEAEGTVGDVLTFSRRASGQICRYQRKQTNAGNEAQVDQRENFLIASVACRGMEYGNRQYGACVYGGNVEDYNARAEGKEMSGYNLCIKEFLLALA